MYTPEPQDPLNQTVETTSMPPIKNNNLVSSILVAIIFTIIGAFGMKSYTDSQIKLSPPPSEFVESTEIESTADESNRVLEKRSGDSGSTGMKVYKNPLLRYGFDYPESEDLFTHDEGYHQQRIDKYGIYVMGINIATNEIGMLSTTIQNMDLQCNSDSGIASVVCTNDKVENYTNPLGTKGFKVSRTIVGKDSQNKITYNEKDHVFVYPMQESISESGAGTTIFYNAVLIYNGNPNPTNLKMMDKIADTLVIE